MLAQIFSLLLGVVAGVIAGSALLRFYMQYQRIPFQHPLGRFVIAVTNWLVLPLRKMLPGYRRWDFSSLIAAFLIVLAEQSIVWALWGRGGYANAAVSAVFAVFSMAIWGIFLLMLVYCVLSLVRQESLAYDVLDDMCSPLLRPFRRLLPLVGGIDLSPMALMVALQIALIVLGGIRTEIGLL